jgi:predicted dehydrogenase
MSIVFRDDQYIPIQGMYSSTWRGDVTKAGAGTLLEHSIHDLDLLEHVLGPVTSVSAQTTDFHGIDGIEDGAAVLLRFGSGALGTLTSVWHDVLERPSLRRVELLSERCHITVKGDWYGPVEWQLTGAAVERREGHALEAEAACRGAVLGNPDGAFIQSIVEDRPAWPSFADAVRAHVLTDAVYRSAAGGGAPVEVPP